MNAKHSVWVAGLLMGCAYGVDFNACPELAKWIRPVEPVPAVKYDCASFVPEVKGRATGFFHVEEIDGKWWAIDPLGRGFVFCGIQSANYGGVYSERTKRANYKIWNDAHGGPEAWRPRCLARLKAWGFNMLGHGCGVELERQGLVNAHELHMGQRFACDAAPDDYAIIKPQGRDACSTMPDMFHPDFPAWCRLFCERRVAPYRDDPWTVGWFVDNELRWWGNGFDRETGFADTVAQLPDNRPAKKAYTAFLAGRPATAELKAAFLKHAARTYFRITCAAIRAADPNHLILGCRFAGLNGAGRAVWEAAGEFCDVVTFNCYPWADLDRNTLQVSRDDTRRVRDEIARYAGYCKRPLLLTEWSFRALDTGHPNSAGAGQVFYTQEQRTRAADMFMAEVFTSPALLGHNFFRWVDQPPEGIRDTNQEDGNYGLVSEQDEPYPITEMFARRQKDLWTLRATTGLVEAKPTALSDPQTALLACCAAPLRASCASDGAAFRLENGTGLVLEGRMGGKALFDAVTLKGAPMGTISYMLNFNTDKGRAWTPLSRVLEASVRTRNDGSVEATVCAEGVGSGVRYEATFAFRVWAGLDRVHMRLVKLVNTGTVPIICTRCYFNQFVPFTPSVESVKRPKDLWKGPMTATWCAADGRWTGAFSFAPHAQFRYYLSPGGLQHPDAAFAPPETFTLAPGAGHTPTRSTDALLLYGFGGSAGWHHACQSLLKSCLNAR